ncbi:fumarylacetoacetate hydrolase family protein [Roseomonas sp. BN140053]|uniref:fumarylacetoacetate hydrolase family protein n=1 Tax=Roseomonas sp. BN140053 TaxID=3391898 RepID=UPI0039E8C7F8
MAEYKLVTYRSGTGKPRAGLVVGDRVHEIAQLAGGSDYATMLDVMEDWDAARPMLEAAANSDGVGGRALAEVELLAPLLYPPTIYCAGANYSDHVAEMAANTGRPAGPDPRSQGLLSWHFIKVSRAVTHPDATVTLPHASKKVDWEVELAAVIGRRAKDVSVESALDYVAGYTAANDLSARDLGARPGVPDGSLFKADWIGQKCFDGACPLGPWIVPASQIGDPQALGLRCWVNDVLKQDSDTGKMIFSLAEQIAHLSSRITLYPGDVVLTGTPAGVGAGRGEFLKSGDVVRVWVEKIGELTNRMA